MRLEILDNASLLDQLKPEWSAFASRLDRVTPFQLPAWLLTWWRHFGSGELHVMLFRHSGEIAAIIPCFCHEWNGRRQLTLLGSGISDYLDPLINPAHSAEVLLRLRTHLFELTKWDICDWQDLFDGSPLLGLAAPRVPVHVRAIPDTPCSEIRIAGTFQEFWAARSKDLRRNLRRYGRRARQEGAISFAVTSTPDPELLDALARLHSDRWQQRGEPGMLEANRSGAFVRDISREFASLGILRFFTLRYREEIVALSLGFLYRNTVYSYLSAFDPQYEILGFGRRLLYESLRYCYRNRRSVWNFCRGDEPYKFSFGAEVIPKSRLVLTRAAAHTA